MPDQPKTQHRSVRISDGDWAALLAAAKTQGKDRGTVIKELVTWYLREPGAKLPARPDREVVLEARHAQEEEAARKAAQAQR